MKHLVISSFTGGSLLRGSLAEYSSLMAAIDAARNLLGSAVEETFVMLENWKSHHRKRGPWTTERISGVWKVTKDNAAPA